MKFFLILYLILINLFGFSVMGIDKRRAIRHRWRVPERVLFGTAFCFGSIGILTGMYVFRHKTRHLSFRLGIPAILALQLLLAGLLFFWNERRLGQPSLAVEQELSRIEELDDATIQSFVSYENLTNSHIVSGSPGDEATKAVSLFFKHFQYHIHNEQIDGDTAEVSATLTNIDMHALAQDLCREILKRAVAVSSVSMTTADYYQLLCDTLSQNSYDEVVTTAWFHLARQEQGWTILVDDELEDALVGGFITCMNDPYILSAKTVLGLHLDALTSLDGAGWKNYLNLNDVFSTCNETYAAQIDDTFAALLADSYGWEILTCHEDGDQAEAAIRITGPDMAATLQTYKESLLSYAATAKSIRDSQSEQSDETSRLLLEALKNTAGTHTTDLSLSFSNNGQTWEISFDEAFTNALMGDLSAALTEFEQGS